MYVRGKYGVSNIYDSGYVNNGYKASVALNSDLRAGRYNGQALKAGDKITIDKNYYIEVLAPGDFLSKKDLKNMNNTSLVLMLHYGSFKMLLTGDAERRWRMRCSKIRYCAAGGRAEGWPSRQQDIVLLAVH